MNNNVTVLDVITEEFYSCPRCEIDSNTKDRMCPCPRASCEAIIIGQLITTKTLIIDVDSPFSKDDLSYAFNAGKNLNNQISNKILEDEDEEIFDKDFEKYFNSVQSNREIILEKC